MRIVMVNRVDRIQIIVVLNLSTDYTGEAIGFPMWQKTSRLIPSCINGFLVGWQQGGEVMLQAVVG